MIWQRSVHEAVFKPSALDYMKLKKEDGVNYSERDFNGEEGHFVEGGLFEVVVPRLASYLMAPDFVDPGFARNLDYFTYNGVTAAGNLSTGQVDRDLEIGALTRNFVVKNAPLRTVIIPAARVLSLVKGGLDESFDFVDGKMSATEAPRQLVYGKRIKLFADGAMFSQRMQVLPPGYIDGHEGEWITPKDAFEAEARKYSNEGYRIHVHVNGDKGVSFVLDVFEKLQMEKPRLPNSVVLEHYGRSNDDLNRRVARLGASVSANPYYLTALGDTYARVGLGQDRAQRLVSPGGLVDRGVTVTLHSDFGMAPASPLFLAWSAITRQTLSGQVFTPPRGLTRDEALKAITVNAAYVLGIDHDLGSIQSGKLADFAVLEADPTEVPVDQLKNIKVWGVVFEGEVHKARN